MSAPVRLEITEEYGPSVIEKLRTGQLDAAIVERDRDDRRSRPPGIRYVPLMFDHYRVVVPASWHIQPSTLAELEGRAWVAGPPGTACDVALRRLLDRPNNRTEARDVCVEFPSVLALVAAGRGAAIVPHLALGHPGTVACPGIDIGGRNVFVAHRRSAAGTDPPVQAVVRALTRAARRADS